MRANFKLLPFALFAGLLVAPLLLFLSGLIVVGFSQTLADTPSAIQADSQTVPDNDEKLGTFYPDNERPGPRPRPSPEPQTRIVLQGPKATIVIDADPPKGRPGIFLYNRETRQSAAVYLTDKGTPVIGIRPEPGWDGRPRPIPAGIFGDAHGNGYLQLREGPGTHVLAPRHIRSSP